ncbi:MAG: TlpA family protein disulfide reductase [Desulfopila sp.]
MKKMTGRCLTVLLLCLSMLAACSSEEQQQVEELAVGDIAPDFALKDTDGNIIILSKFSAYPVVLRFFETDCRYCRADTPIINVYFEKYRDTGLKVFYVAAYHESKASVTGFINDLDVSFPVIMDNGAKLADMYNILLYPQTIMLAPGRKVMAIIPGGVGEAELDELVGPYLQQNPSVAQSRESEEE